MKQFINALLILAIIGVISPAEAQKKKKKKGETAEAKKKPETKSKIKKYSDVITKEAVTDEGLFTVHKVIGDYYFEIPKDLLEKEILVVSRISGFVDNLNFGGAGMKSRPQQVIRLQAKDEKILIRSVSFNSVADEDNPVYQSVVNNNFEPIIASFDIKAYNQDSTGYIIEVNKFFTSDVPMIGAISERQRKDFKVSGIDGARSLINWVKSFPENVEVRHVLTYKGKELPSNRLTNTMSIEMNQSFILLPEEQWAPRYYDPRVGYFSIRQTDYSLDAQKAKSRRFITRWKLVPKDWDAYNRGELVEPVQPIVYYIDPGTPEQWRKYIKQGVDDWKIAFEKAGFKNAIMAKDPPSKEEDPDWSPEDVRYSVIRYITTDIQNAQGPHVHDPRTGQILESDILWYHNVMNLLRNWYLVQTAAVNPKARGVQFEEEVMGELIRFVAAHEVGHTLGLPHNMGSSVAYPVDSLRSKTFTDTHGTAPSIMDYARFNYIAQPEDGITNLMPQIGEYDEWSIMYGYKLLADKSPEEERSILNDWIKERASDPAMRYGRQQRGVIDPTSQTEDLGDNSMRSSDLGLKNLKRILPNLLEWSAEEGRTYEELNELYSNVISQLRRYSGHVSSNIGGIYIYPKTSDQEGEVFTHVESAKQKDAVKWMNSNIFNTPSWLLDKDILSRIDDTGAIDRIKGLQTRALNSMMNGGRLNRMMENEALNGGEAYNLIQYFSDVRKGIWAEVRTGRKIDPFRRNLQKAYIETLSELMEKDDDDHVISDVKSIVRANLNLLSSEIKKGINAQRDTMSKYHLQDAVERIDAILNPNG